MTKSFELSVSPRQAGEADGYNSAWREARNEDQYELESDRRHYEAGWAEGFRRGQAAMARLQVLEERLRGVESSPMRRVVPETFTEPRRPPGVMKIRQAKKQDYYRKKTKSKSKVKNKRLFGRSR